MNVYVYHWSVRPQSGLVLDLRVTAPSVVVAQRQVRRFLIEHDGDTWAIECVDREVARVPLTPLAVPLRPRR